MEIENIEQYKQQLFEKRDMLSNAVVQLKKEFVGINHVIDQVAESINSWLFFPEMQTRPVIVNLWGLTGIGKTSLVKRLAELIGYSERYFRFDLGESTGRYYDIQDSFKDIYENCDGEPFIISLDEFQLARTINEERKEIDKASTRSIWDLLDTGKFELIDFDYNLHWYNRLIKNLDRALDKGVEVENGMVISNADIFKELVFADIETEEMEDEDDLKKDKPIYFLSDEQVKTIYSMVENMFADHMELRNKLNRMDGEESINFLIMLYKKMLRPKTIDCTQSLVFIMGNLDEVYTMNKNFNPDMSANEFHRQSTEITITQVKDALLARFRSEQIARLGNTHIIYPAFNEKSFYDIIRLELEKIRTKVMDRYGLEILFDEKVEQLIYDEGVYPTQGTRPVFTTVHQIINTRLGKILNEIYLNGIHVDLLVFTVNADQAENDHAELQINFSKDNQIIHTLTDRQPLVLGKLRKEKKNDEQAIIAVHESGHAILSAILMRTIPDCVLSVTADSQSNGFVFARPEWNYVSKREIICRLAVLLGGFTAEKIIFGEDNITMGSGSDLKNATEFATMVIYSCGMGTSTVAFGNQHVDGIPSFIMDSPNNGVNTEARELMQKAGKLAEDTLLRQKVLLLHMADYLSDKRAANKGKIREFLEKYAVDFDTNKIVENADDLFYRKHLKRLVSSLKPVSKGEEE